MQDTTEHPQNGHLDSAEHRYDKLELTAAAIRLGIGVDGVRRRLQRGSIQGVKEDGKWFVLLPAEQLQNAPGIDTEQLNQSAEQPLTIEGVRYISFLETQNEKLWKELEERRREVSELHILLRREQEQQEMGALPAPIDFVQHLQNNAEQDAEQTQNRRKPWWRFWK